MRYFRESLTVAPPAEVLITEITRRVNLENIWQAVYTAGVVLPKPASECRYYHRSLNPKKLIDVRGIAPHASHKPTSSQDPTVLVQK